MIVLYSLDVNRFLWEEGVICFWNDPKKRGGL